MKAKYLRAIILGYFLIAGIAVASPDPLNTDKLTTNSPNQFWHGNVGFQVNSHPPKLLIQLPERPLTLGELTDYALRNNPTTWLAWAQAKQAAANVGLAKGAYLPQVAGGAAASYSADVFVGEHNSQTNFGPNVSLSYVLWDFGNRANTLKSARYLSIAANLNQNTQIQQLMLQVEQAYYSVLGQQALMGANEKTVAQAQTSLDAAQALRKYGVATIGDVYQAQSSLAQAKLDLTRVQGDYQIALGQLTTSMGLSANYPLKLVPLGNNRPITQINAKVEQLLAWAKRYRPDLLAAEAAMRASQAQLAATKAAVWPVLQVTATAGPHVVDTTSITGTSSSVSLTIPLFTGFQQTYNVRSAKAQVQISQATRDQLDQQIAFQVWQAYYTLQTAQKNIVNADSLMTSSEQAVKQAIGQYKAGVGNILTVLTTQASLANARVQSIQARLSWYIALAQLSAAVGVLGG